MATSLTTRLNDGNVMATEVVSNILNSLVEQPFQDVEEACINYLKNYNGSAVIEEFESKRAAHKKSDRHVIEILTHHTSLTANQSKNQSLRFGLEENSSNQRQSWGFGSKNMFCGVMGSSNTGESRDYEEVTNPDIINAPITDICIIQRGDPIPPGFYRLSRTTTMKKANLNTSSGGNNIYLCIKKDAEATHFVTAIMLFFPDKNEFIPPDFIPVRRGQRPCNINAGTSFERIFIGYKKETVGNFITDLNVIFPSKGEEPPKGFNLLDRSPTGIPANLNTGTAGCKIFLCYKQKLTRIACLNQELSQVSRRGSLRSMSSVLPTSALSMLSLQASSPSSAAEGGAEGVDNDGTTIDVNDLELDASETAADDLEYTDMVYHEDQDVNLFANAVVVYNDGRIVNAQSRKALFAILSALFIRREGPAIIALQGLTRLLKESNFFESDLKSPHQSGCVTMLDVTVDALCDRFEDCVESEFDAVLQFIRILTRHAACKFSTMAVQKFFRAFHFLSRYYSSRHPFRSGNVNMPTNENGSELLVFKVFREFIYNTQGIVENVPVEHFLPSEQSAEIDEVRAVNISENEKLISELTLSLVNDVIESMEISHISESCLVLLSKHNMSPLVSTFWQHISGFSKLLFVDCSYRSSFVLLCAICKQAWLTPRPCSTGTNVREIGAKLLALEALYEFCISAGEKMRLSKIFGYTVRRLVVPCVLFNVTFAFEDHRIFAKLLKIITALWKVWRAHCRIEFAILCEHLVIQVLQAPQSKIKPLYQRLVLEEVVLWFDQPHLLLEMFVNYDIDRKFVSQWNIFSYLVRAVCTIARRAATIDWSSENISNKSSTHRPPSSPSSGISGISGGISGGSDGFSSSHVSSRELSLNALEQVCRIAKTIMDATGHAHLMLKDSKFRSLSLGTGKGWEENTDHEHDSGAVSGVKLLRADHQQAEEMVKEAIKIYKEKDSIKKAVAFLVSKGFMADSPQDITSFLRAYKTSFDPTAIGDYLGEGGVTAAEINYWTQIRFRYVRAVSFVGLEVESALRLFLTGCGFRLPGESQKIDRLVETFVKAYWQDNHGTSLCSFQAPDTIHILSFAMIMLNTDLHVANLNNKKKNKRMTKEEFINNLRGVDSGLSPEYLGTVYDNIAANRIEMPFQTPTRPDSKNNNSISSNNINNNNNNMMSNNNNSGGGASGGGITSGGNNNNIGNNNSSSGGNNNINNSNSIINNNNSGVINPMEEREFAKSIGRELRSAEDLLRSLSKYTFGFQMTGVDTNISLDLVSFMYETVWYLFHAITDALLTTPIRDINVTFAALDILSYSLTSSIFLNLQVEKMTIATQLKNFREGFESSGNQTSRPTITDDSWFTDVETSTSATAMETIPKVLKLMVRLKDSIQQAQNYELTRKVASRIERKANILDQNTYFVREGDLWKRSANGHNLKCYRFFLFSDYLLYAHQSITGEYRVHEQLQLTQMSVSDVEDDNTNCSFYIDHPVKSFVVVADSIDTKYAWIRDIQQTTATCRNREAQMNSNSNRKMSIIGRIEDQQEEQLNRLSKRITSTPQTSSSTTVSSSSSSSSSTSSVTTPTKTIQQDASANGTSNNSNNSNNNSNNSNNNSHSVNSISSGGSGDLSVDSSPANSEKKK